MSDELVLTNMHVCGRQIAQVFETELDARARARLSEKLLALMRLRAAVQADMEPRLMLLGALSAVGQEALADPLPAGFHRPGTGR
ncbi:hypothetical protein [Pseudoduganella rhizocola]|uniref:hypothetical protein n=1 Tax=Pseudoduganella rhizocola TaxID=3382643 RepID=UPI0038B63422